MSFSVADLKALHAYMMNDESPCGFRSHNVSCLTPARKRLLFVPHDRLETATAALLNQVERRLARVTQNSQVCQALAEFWCVMIYILHPFHDGNGRVAKAYLELNLEDRGLQLEGFRTLEAYEPTQKLNVDCAAVARILCDSISASSPSRAGLQLRYDVDPLSGVGRCY